jgi:YVTN family beta-propeller protein
MKISYSIICLAVILICNQSNGQTIKAFHLSKTFKIASAGSWDYITVDENSNRLYVSHATQVNVLDKNTGDSIGVIPNTTGVHGIALVPALGKGYTSNGKLNNVSVFDLKTLQVLTQINTGENPDAIMYDAFSKKIITCNGRSKDLTIIDPVTEQVVATIPVGGKLETAVSDLKGRLYVNNEDKHEIAVIDLTNNKLITQWSLAPGESPTGLVIDRKNNRLFATCDKLLVAIDIKDGKIISTIPIGEGCDGAAFDPSNGLVFTSNGAAASISVIKSGKTIELLSTINSKRSAKTIAIDTKSHKIYLPAAEMEPVPADAPKGTRPKMIPGTFQILVFEQ